MTKHTRTPWGVSVFDKDLATGEPRKEGAMIVSPPGRESLRRIQEGKFGFTSMRVAMLEATHYTPHDVACANAEFIARACNAHEELLAACKLVMQQAHWSDMPEAVDACQAAIARAESP